MGARLSGILLSFGLLGCQSMPQPRDETKTYEYDLTVEVNGLKGEGNFVVPEASKYSLRIDARGGIDLFAYKTCNREVKVDKPLKSGWFGARKRLEFDFIPNEHERKTGCSLELKALNESNKDSFAYVHFQIPKYSLPATLECNGETIQSNGVSACQARAGLKQVIKFDVSVVTGNFIERCKIPTPDNTGGVAFVMPAGFCEYRFYDAKNARWHRMYTIGYQGFIVKGLPQ